MPVMPPALDCPMDQVLAALAGDGPLPHHRSLEQVLPPPHGRVAPPPPGGGKALYGGRMDHHVDSANFTVAWSGNDTTEEAAQRASDALEQAWTALVEQQGWPQPTSSEDWLIWAIFDPTLSGTGLTVLYYSDDFPQGYPVILLNPAWVDNQRFFASLSAHEFHHAVQFAMRDYYGGDEEAWYWEASAEWAAELALPDNNSYGAQAVYYTDLPHLRYSSTQGYHQYGMFLLNAWMEEHETGPGGMRAVWETAVGRDGEDWDTILSDALGMPPEEIWGGFTAAMGAEDLREWRYYQAPVRAGVAEDGAGARLDYLGTHYYDVDQDGAFSVEGAAWLSGPMGQGTEVDVQAGDTLAVTWLGQQAGGYTLLEAEPEDSSPPGKDPAGVCGVVRGGPWWGALALLLGLRRRR